MHSMYEKIPGISHGSTRLIRSHVCLNDLLATVEVTMYQIGHRLRMVSSVTMLQVR